MLLKSLQSVEFLRSILQRKGFPSIYNPSLTNRDGIERLKSQQARFVYVLI